MRTTALLLFLLFSTAPHIVSNANAQEGHGQLRCTAAAIGTGGLRTPPVTTSLDVVVERWSSEAERQRLVQSLKQGQEAILNTVQHLPRVGYLRTPTSLGWELHFAQSAPGEDGGQRIVLATDRFINFWEAVNQPRSIDYPFTFIQLQLNNDGEGKGSLSVATKVITANDGKFVQLETYDAPPVQLNDVKCR